METSSKFRSSRYIVLLEGKNYRALQQELSNAKITCIKAPKSKSARLRRNHGFVIAGLRAAVVNLPRRELEARFGAENVMSDFELRSSKPQNSRPFIATVAVAATETVAATEAWGRKAVFAPGVTPTGKGIKVCVIDSGLMLHPRHPDFKDVNVTARRFSDDDADTQGHGTQCAGIICGPAGPSLGAQRYGVAPDVELFVANVFGSEDSTNVALVCDALSWAIEQGCHIVSMSLEAYFTPAQARRHKQDIEKFNQLVARAQEANVLLIACTGNASDRDTDGKPAPSAFPARCTGVLAVGGVKHTGNGDPDAVKIMNMSNDGAHIYAPGEEILSAWKDGNYMVGSGTSFASAFVAGIAALYAQDDEELRGEKLRNALLVNAGREVDKSVKLVRAPRPRGGPVRTTP